MGAKFGRAKSLLKGVLVTVVLLLQVRGAEAQEWNPLSSILEPLARAYGAVRYGASDIRASGESAASIQRRLNDNQLADMASDPLNAAIRRPRSITSAQMAAELPIIAKTAGDIAEGALAAGDLSGIKGVAHAGVDLVGKGVAKGAAKKAIGSSADDVAAVAVRRARNPVVRLPATTWEEVVEQIPSYRQGGNVAVFLAAEGVAEPVTRRVPTILIDPKLIQTIAGRRPTSVQELILMEAAKLQSEIIELKKWNKKFWDKTGALPKNPKRRWVEGTRDQVGSRAHAEMKRRVEEQLKLYPELERDFKVLLEEEFALGKKGRNGREEGWVRIDALDQDQGIVFDYCFSPNAKSSKQIGKQLANAPKPFGGTKWGFQIYIPY